MKPLKGVLPPMITVFDEDNNFDPIGTGKVIDRAISAGVHGILILGTGGEMSNLSAEIRKEIAEFAVSHIDGRVPILLGIGACDTQTVIDLGKHAQSIGIKHVLVVNPYYARLSDEAMYNHFATIAGSLDISVYLYNFPLFTGQDISVELIKRLADDCENIRGLKDTVDTISHTRQVITDVKSVYPNFAVFAGFDEYLLEVLLIGGDGAIPATSTFAPELTVGVYEAFQKKDWDQIISLKKRLANLMKIYGIDSPFFGVVKETIRMTGSDISAHPLLPTRPPEEDKRNKIKEILDSAKVKYTD